MHAINNTKKTLTLLLTSFVLTFALCIAPACSNTDINNKITSTQFPNTVAENAQINDQYKDEANSLKASFIEEFMEITKIPRPSGHMEKIREYIYNWGVNHRLPTQIDKSGCVVMDLPATAGYENRPNVILQAHMDMVAVSNDPAFAPLTSPIDAKFDESTGKISTEGKSSLGSDDAEGIATIFALAKSNIKHGNIRCVFTYDEETTMEGAKAFSPELINANYMINIDTGPVGIVTVSSAGSYKAEMSKQYTSLQEEGKQVITVNLKGLKGGHSGMDINKGGYNAIDMCKSMVDAVVEKNIGYQLVSLDSGKTTNSIASSAVLKIVVDPNNVDQAKDTIKAYLEKAKNGNNYDKEFTFDITDANEVVGAFSVVDSQEIFETIKQIPFGVIKMSDNNITPLTSCNLGQAQISNGKFFLSFQFRSSEEGVVDEFDKKISSYASSYGISLNVLNKYPAWPKSEDSSFSDYVLKSYKESSNIEGSTDMPHAGLETCWFLDKHPGLKIVCVGADTENEHNVTETLYTKSLPAHFAMFIYALENLS